MTTHPPSFFSETDCTHHFHINTPLCLAFLKQHFDLSTILFLGYSLSDPDIRQVLSSSIFDTGGSKRDDFAILNRPSDASRDLWHRKGVSIIGTDKHEHTIDIVRKIAASHTPQSVDAIVSSLELSKFSIDFRHFQPLFSKRLISVAGGSVPISLVSTTEKPGKYPRVAQIPDDVEQILAVPGVHLIEGSPGAGKTVTALKMIATKAERAGHTILSS